MKMTDNQIKQMVDRFLGWKLPIAFHPDAGITFAPGNKPHSSPHWPIGTNLFSAEQAEAMVRYMLDGVGSNVQIEARPALGASLSNAGLGSANTNKAGE